MSSASIDSTAIIIPVSGDITGLKCTLDALQQQGGDVMRQVFVAVDGGPREVADYAASRQVRCAYLETNRGSYAARNWGINHTNSEYLLFIDAGVEPAAGWYQEMLRALATADYVAGGIGFAPRNQDASFAEAYQLVYGFPVEVYFAEHGYGPTANVGVRRTVFARAGLFDERLRSGGDDEFGYRVRRLGISQAYAPAAKVIHEYRTYADLIVKQRRVVSGRKRLAEVHPDHFSLPRHPLISRLLRLLPPLQLKRRADAPPGWRIRGKAFVCAWLLRALH